MLCNPSQAWFDAARVLNTFGLRLKAHLANHKLRPAVDTFNAGTHTSEEILELGNVVEAVGPSDADSTSAMAAAPDQILGVLFMKGSGNSAFDDDLSTHGHMKLLL